MAHLRIALLLALCLAWPSLPANARDMEILKTQTNAQNVRVLDNVSILQQLRSSLGSIKSLKYLCYGYEREETFASMIIEWKETQKGSYHFRFEEFLKGGKRNFVSEKSYDGTRLMSFLEDESLLRTTTRNEPMAVEIINSCALLSPFDFLIGSLGEKAWERPLLQVLNDDEVWRQAARNMESLRDPNAVRDGRCMMRFLHARNLLYKGDVTYEVELDPKNGYLPKGWVAKNDKGEILSTLQILETLPIKVNGSSIMMPSKIKVSFFGLDYEKVFKKPTNTQTYVFKDIEIDTENSESISIDPSMASTIYDLDTKTSITVPK